jgi:serine/threonine-protein kinase
VRGALGLLRLRDGIRLRKAEVAAGRLDFASADRDYARLFRERGLGAEGEDEEAVAARLRGSAVRAQLVAALDDWAATTGDPGRRAWLLGVARRAQPDPWGDRIRDPAAWRDRAALERLAREARGAGLSPQLLAAVGVRLRRLGADPVPLLQAAQARHPADFWLNFDLGTALWEAGQGQAAEYFRAALAVRPDAAAVYTNLGAALQARGELDEAVAAYRRALALEPKFAPAHTSLGAALYARGQPAEAVAAHREALRLEPTLARAHTNLGLALQAQGKLGEAVAALRGALRLDPKSAWAHASLGAALQVQGELGEAVAAYREALRLDPKSARAHTNLGAALQVQGKLGEAVAAGREALRLDPTLALAHANLGSALRARGQLDEAVAAYRQALCLDHTSAVAHTNLGNGLSEKGQLGEAVAAYRQALRLDPKLAHAHAALGRALLLQGKFVEAKAATAHGLDLIPPNHPLRQPVTQQLQQCEGWLALEGRLRAVLRGQAKPAGAAERLALAQLCQRHKQLYAAAARFYAEAFAEEPRLAQDPRAGHRYDAACAAALAAGGRGKDAAALDDQERARLRARALDWLRADLAGWVGVAAKGSPKDRPAVRGALRRWLEDADLAALRDPEGLAGLPAAERQAWRRLWAEVGEALKKAPGPEPAP